MKNITIYKMVLCCLFNFSYKVFAQSYNMVINQSAYPWCQLSGNYIEGPNYGINYSNSSTYNNGNSRWLRARAYKQNNELKFRIRGFAPQPFKCNIRVNVYRIESGGSSVLAKSVTIPNTGCNTYNIYVTLSKQEMHSTGTADYYLLINNFGYDCTNSSNACSSITGTTVSSLSQVNNGNSMIIGKWGVDVTTAHDEPCTAEYLTSSYNCSYESTENYFAKNSSINSPPCGNYQGKDVWYYFNTPSYGYAIEVDNLNNINDLALAVYDGTCNSPQFLECDDNSGGNSKPYIERVGDPFGQSHYIRVWNPGGTDYGSFDICIKRLRVNFTTSNITDIERGTNFTLSWTKNFTQSGVTIKLVKGSQEWILGTGITGSSYNVTIPSNIPIGANYGFRIEHDNNSSLRDYLGHFNIRCSFTSPLYTDSDYSKFCDLASWNIILPRLDAYPNTSLIRDDGVSMLASALLNTPQGGANSPAINHPTFAKDLQAHNNHKFAILADWLYGDNESVLKRAVNYHPGEFFQRRYFIKALWETFGLPTYTIPINGGAPIFSTSQGVIGVGEGVYKWLLPAYENGILPNTSNLDAPITKREACLLIWTVLTNLDSGWAISSITGTNTYYRPSLAQVEDINNYRIPFYTDLYNLGIPLDISDGVFGHYVKSGISVEGDNGMGCASSLAFYGGWEHLPSSLRIPTHVGKNPNWVTNYHDYFLVFDEIDKSFNSTYEVSASVDEKSYAIGFGSTGYGQVFEFSSTIGNVWNTVSHGNYNMANTTAYSANHKEFKITDRDSRISKYYTYYYDNEEGGSVYLLTRIADSYGNTVLLTYEPGLVISKEDGTTEQAYRLHHVVPAGGGPNKRFTYIYDTGDPSKLIEIQDNSLGTVRSTFITYLGNNIHTISDALVTPNLWTYTYQSGANDHQLYTVTWPEGNQTTINMVNNLVSTIDLPNNGTITVQPNYNYNNGVITKTVTQQQLGIPTVTTSITSPYSPNYSSPNHGYVTNVSSSSSLGTNTTTYQRTDMNHPSLPTNITSSKGVGINLTYNNGHLTSQVLTGALGQTIVHGYTWINDLLVNYTDPEGENWEVTHNGHGDIETVKDAKGTIIAQYIRNNSNGNLERVEYPTSSSTTPLHPTLFQNYIHGVPQQVIRGNRTINIGVNGAGLIISSQLGTSSYSSTYTYNDQLDVFRDLGTKSIDHDYTGNGEIETITTNTGDVTSISYDPTTRLVESITRHGKTRQIGYDSNNGYRVKTITDRNGNIRNVLYYSSGVFEGLLQDNGDAEIEYYNDPTNPRDKKLLRITKKSTTNNGPQRSYAYDEFGRWNREVIQFSNGYSHALDYGLNKRGQTINIDYGGKMLTYTRDENGKITEIHFDGQLILTTSYFSDGRKEKRIFNNGYEEVYAYDQFGNRKSAMVISSSNSNNFIGGYDLSFNVENKITNWNYYGQYAPTQPLSPRQRVPVINTTNNRLQSMSGHINNIPLNLQFSYNDKGEINTMTGTINATLTHDINGYITNFSHPTLPMQAIYDGVGNRVEVDRNGVVYRYVLDTRGLGDILVELDANNNILYYYVYDDEGLTARIAPNGDIWYYHHNWRGDTKLMTDQNGNITHRYVYDTYGELSEVTEPSNDINRFRFSGKWGVVYENGMLYYHRKRYYNPVIRRFWSEDPVWNYDLYEYAEGDPINYIDIDGKQVQTLPGMVAVHACGVTSYTIDYFTRLSYFINDPYDPRGQYNLGIDGTLAYGDGLVLCESLGLGRIKGKGVKSPANVSTPTLTKVERIASVDFRKVNKAAKTIVDWLGPNSKIKTNPAGDKVFISADGLRKIRFDVKNPGKINGKVDRPHFHLEFLNENNKWIDAIPGNHRLYFLNEIE